MPLTPRDNAPHVTCHINRGMQIFWSKRPIPCALTVTPVDRCSKSIPISRRRLTIAAPVTIRMAVTAVPWSGTFCMHLLPMVALTAMPARVRRSQSIAASNVIRKSRNRCHRRITTWCDTEKTGVWPVIRHMPEMIRGCSRARSVTSVGLATKPLSSVTRRQNTVM